MSYHIKYKGTYLKHPFKTKTTSMSQRLKKSDEGSICFYTYFLKQSI